MNKFSAFTLSMGVAAAVAACSTADQVDKEAFEYAINEQLSNDCLMLTTRDSDFPVTVDVPQTDREKLISVNSDKIEQYDALVEAGLLDAKNEQREISSTLTDKSKVVSAVTYSLTGKGQQALKEIEMQSAMGGVRKGFCVASYKVDDILEFSEPNESMGETVSYVRYTMAPTGIKEWGQSLAVQEAFPSIASRLESTRQENATMVLSDDGWEMKTAM